MDNQRLDPNFIASGEGKTVISGSSREDCLNKIHDLCKKNNIVIIKEWSLNKKENI